MLTPSTVVPGRLNIDELFKPAKAGKPEDMAWWHLPPSCPQGSCTLHLRAQAQGSLVTVLQPLLLRWKLNMLLIVPKCLRGLVMDPK